MATLTKRIPLAEFVQHLRDNPTPEEAIIRPGLEARGFVFQYPIEPYVVDFHNAKYRISVEIDGGSHDPRSIRERDRMREIACQGLFLRFPNASVREQLSQCLETVDKFIDFWDSARVLKGANILMSNVWDARADDITLSFKQSKRAQKLFGMSEAKMQEAIKKARKER